MSKQTPSEDSGNTAARTRLTREDWIAAAITLLVTKSIDSVRIEPMAARLAVSRGSFYWHFKSRDELLEAVLATWRERQTRRIIERLKQDLSLDPMQRLVRLRSQSAPDKRSRDAAALELSIRAWARRDKLARRVVEEVDRERLEVAVTFLIDAGMAPESADQWALIGYAYTLGMSVLGDVVPAETAAACKALLMRVQFPEADSEANSAPH